MDPWETSALTGDSCQDFQFIIIWLLLKNEEIRPNSIFYRTWVKVTASVSPVLLKTLNILSSTTATTFAVECE